MTDGKAAPLETADLGEVEGEGVASGKGELKYDVSRMFRSIGGSAAITLLEELSVSVVGRRNSMLIRIGTDARTRRTRF